MPYPSEHSCRLENPDKYIRIRRENDKFGVGIHAIWGIQAGSKPVELQAIRFSSDKFTAATARAWLKTHDYKCKMFEPATGKCEKCGKPMLIIWGEDVSGENCGKTCDLDFTYEHDGDCVEECKEPEHWIEKCSKCGKIISTCRCSSPDKAVRLSICPECKGNEDLDKLKVALDAIEELRNGFAALKNQLNDLSARFSALSEAGERGSGEGEPSELVIVDSEKDKEATREVIRGAVIEVLGELTQAEIDRMKGRVK